MAKTLVEVRNPNDPGHIGDHELSARLLNELYGVAAYAPAAGGTVNPDIALGGVHEIALPAGAVTVGPIVSSDSAAIQRYNPGQRLVLVLTQPAAGGATVTWDASWRRTTSGIDPRPNAVTTIEFVNDAAAGAAPQWRPSAIAPTALESVRVWHTDTANPAVVVRGAAGQATDLTQWQSSAGTVVARVDQVGSLQARLGSFAAGAATEVPLTAQGAASQTADLQRWLSSAAAVLAKVDAAGILTAAGLVTAGLLTVSGGGAHSVVGSLTETGQTLSKPSVASQVPQVMQGFASQSADLTQWQSSAAAVLASVAADGSGTFANLTTAGTVTGRLARWTATAAADVPAIVKAAAAQTGDLQQWQNSAGTVLTTVDSGGRVNASGGIHVGGTAHQGLAYLEAFTPSATTKAMIVRGAASQSSNLTEWQDSTGATLSRFANNGDLYIGSLHYFSTNTASNPSVLLRPSASGNIGVRIQAQAGQSNDPFQVTDSGAVRLVSANQFGDWTVQGQISFRPGSSYLGQSGSWPYRLVSTGTGNGGLIVQRVAGQTADMMIYWNESTGWVSWMDSGGNWHAPSFISTSDARMKENVRDLPHADPLDVVRRLRPRHFDFIDGDKGQIGFVAQEVEPHLPHAVRRSVRQGPEQAEPQEILGLHNDTITAYLVAAVQQLDRRTASAA